MLNAHAMPTYRGEDVQATDTHNQIFLSGGKSAARLIHMTSAKSSVQPKCCLSHMALVTFRAPVTLFFVIRPVPNKDGLILCYLPWDEEAHENIMKTGLFEPRSL